MLYTVVRQLHVTARGRQSCSCVCEYGRWGNVVPKKRTIQCSICDLNPHGAATNPSRRCLWSVVRINTGSHVRFCSDPQPLGGKLRDSYKLLALKKWIYLHSCLSTWLQQRSAELASVFGRSCALMYTANRSWRAQTFTDEVMFKVLFMPSLVFFCVSPVLEAAPLSWTSTRCNRSPKTLVVEAQAEGFWDCVFFAVGYYQYINVIFCIKTSKSCICMSYIFVFKKPITYAVMLQPTLAGLPGSSNCWSQWWKDLICKVIMKGSHLSEPLV